MRPRPPRSTRTDTIFPSPPLFRSGGGQRADAYWPSRCRRQCDGTAEEDAMRRILKLITHFALTVALSGGAYAMGGGSADGGAAKADPNYAAARQLVEHGKYAEPNTLMEQMVAQEATHSDALNYHGYNHPHPRHKTTTTPPNPTPPLPASSSMTASMPKPSRCWSRWWPRTPRTPTR